MSKKWLEEAREWRDRIGTLSYKQNNKHVDMLDNLIEQAKRVEELKEELNKLKEIDEHRLKVGRYNYIEYQERLYEIDYLEQQNECYREAMMKAKEILLAGGVGKASDVAYKTLDKALEESE